MSAPPGSGKKKLANELLHTTTLLIRCCIVIVMAIKHMAVLSGDRRQWPHEYHTVLQHASASGPGTHQRHPTVGPLRLMHDSHIRRPPRQALLEDNPFHMTLALGWQKMLVRCVDLQCYRFRHEI